MWRAEYSVAGWTQYRNATTLQGCAAGRPQMARFVPAAALAAHKKTLRQAMNAFGEVLSDDPDVALGVCLRFAAG